MLRSLWRESEIRELAQCGERDDTGGGEDSFLSEVASSASCSSQALPCGGGHRGGLRSGLHLPDPPANESGPLASSGTTTPLALTSEAPQCCCSAVPKA